MFSSLYFVLHWFVFTFYSLVFLFIYCFFTGDLGPPLVRPVCITIFTISLRHSDFFYSLLLCVTCFVEKLIFLCRQDLRVSPLEMIEFSSFLLFLSERCHLGLLYECLIKIVDLIPFSLSTFIRDHEDKRILSGVQLSSGW